MDGGGGGGLRTRASGTRVPDVTGVPQTDDSSPLSNEESGAFHDP